MEQVVEVARNGAKIEISKEALEKMAATRAHIESLAASETPV
jgi:histidine ammonia-lyase